MANLASGGRLWSQDKVNAASYDDDEALLVVLIAFIVSILAIVFVFIIPLSQDTGKDVSHSISVNTSHNSLGEGR